ncbi:hypothetical protein EYF80_007923 [Liparis tanakae]|uniref:Uncharacterized protein n=1 Tax=Liparis tanakae TaxID=230148 RepID=A0A4Z2IW60_9TELE|nr:hypothetical protein EYF80_007923 [Liparis tanakae]
MSTPRGPTRPEMSQHVSYLQRPLVATSTRLVRETASEPAKEEFLLGFRSRGGLQKSTSQPELSSGGGSSLSSGKLSNEETRERRSGTKTVWGGGRRRVKPARPLEAMVKSLLGMCGGPPHQLNAAKSADSQSVDDVEVGEVEVEEKGVLCFVSVVPGQERDSIGEGLERS